ncbi:MAG: hypothetical protein HZA35_03760 [Parcubacteria group bacterium]|nr:hypothetical protein [Parcubacteria group bacterium]
MNLKKKELNSNIEKTRTPIKAFLGVVFIFVTALVLGFLGGRTLSLIPLFGMSSSWWFLGGSIIFLSFLCLSALLFTERRLVVIVHIVGVVGLSIGAAFFPKDVLDILFLTLIIFAVMWGGHLIFHEKEEGLKIRWSKVIRGGMGWYLNALALFLVMLYMSMFGVATKRVVLPEVYVRDMIDSTMPIIQKFLPGFSGGLEFDAFLKQEAERRFDVYAKESLGAGIDLNTPQVKAQKKQIVRDVVKELGGKWEEFTGSRVEPSTSLYDVAYSSINEKIIPQGFKETPLFLVAIGVLGFLIVRSFGIFVYWGVLVVGYIFLELLIIIGIVTIQFEPRSKETLLLS